MKNAINWFEIPVTDFNRAKKFYSTLMGNDLTDYEMPDGQYAVFPYDPENNGISGGIIKMKDLIPSQNGVTIYLNGGEDLNGQLAKVEPAGGTVIIPKTAIGENGFFAQFIDTEGNRIALHSMS
ncbi:MAG: VOC family protein [Crocinitomicaceae bacterium]|nr:VOC family protein [Crocinitomicaceae bacterium]